MTAMEKVAWTEFLVAIAATIAATALIPWLGSGAAGAFGLLGFIGFGIGFLRHRGAQVIVDERDREIERLAARRGVETAWMTLFISLIAIVVYSSYTTGGTVDTWILSWLIWIQFAVCYGVKGLTAILAYRAHRHAA